MDSPTSLRTYRDRALSAIAAGDYDAALRAVESMQVVLAATPDQELSTGHKIAWDRRVSELHEQIRRRRNEVAASRARGGGIQRTKLHRYRVSN